MNKKCKSCNSVEFMKKLEYGIYHYCHSYCYKCQELKNKDEDHESDTDVNDIENSIDELERLFKQ